MGEGVGPAGGAGQWEGRVCFLPSPQCRGTGGGCARRGRGSRARVWRWERARNGRNGSPQREGGGGKGREGRAARLGSVPGPADGEALRGAGRFPPGGGESRALFGGGGGGGGVQELCRSPCLLAVVPSPVPRPASLGSLDFPPSPPCSPSSLTSTPPSVTPPITGLHQGPQQN